MKPIVKKVLNDGTDESKNIEDLVNFFNEKQINQQTACAIMMFVLTKCYQQNATKEAFVRYLDMCKNLWDDNQ